MTSEKLLLITVQFHESAPLYKKISQNLECVLKWLIFNSNLSKNRTLVNWTCKSTFITSSDVWWRAKILGKCTSSKAERTHELEWNYAVKCVYWYSVSLCIANSCFTPLYLDVRLSNHSSKIPGICNITGLLKNAYVSNLRFFCVTSWRSTYVFTFNPFTAIGDFSRQRK